MLPESGGAVSEKKHQPGGTEVPPDDTWRADMGHPTVYPTGVTIFNPEKAWNGYTILPAPDKGALLIGMTGHEIRLG